jgi:hypothetical protein
VKGQTILAVECGSYTTRLAAVPSTMPVSWRIEGSLILLESDEQGTFGEWMAAIDGVVGSPGWRPGLNVVHDLRTVRELPGAIETVLRLDFLMERGPALGIKRYAVVLADSTHPGVGRVAEGLARGSVLFRVFRDWTGAAVWARQMLSGPPSR